MVSEVEEIVGNRMEFYQDCMEGEEKSLPCSTAKHPVRNEQYVIGHCHTAIGSHFGAMDVPFNMLCHCSQDIRVVRAVYGSTGTATAGSDVVQSGRPIFDDFFQHLWPFIGNNTANVVFQMVKRLWLIRIDQ
ncbi:hypothetical protein TNCV_3311371 [Trichonephila clavipes]|nr:hypothetical protein TNCV_3311371 [Trichonephila clavipes]